jgi:AcrR family transcriptional regulator
MNMNSKNGLRDKFRESTREAILEAAAEIIISNSGEVRMEDIAARAGVATGTLYNYFENRQMLIDKIMEKRHITAEMYIRQSLEQTEEKDITARLENLFQTLFNFLDKHKTATHHSLELKEKNDNRSGNKSFMTMMNDYFMEMLQTALKRKEIRLEYMDIYPLVISGYIRSIFKKVEDSDKADRGPDIARKMAELFMTGAGEKKVKMSNKSKVG